MATSSDADLLTQIKQSGLFPDRAYVEIANKVSEGGYPRGSAEELARALVEDKTLTKFQAKRLLESRGRELVIGRYVIMDRLGKGSMGEVYRAQHFLMGRTVALKRIANDIANNEKAVARFQREMRLVGRLDHPNVVRAFDADSKGKLLYLVMEHVQGRSLLELLKANGPLRIPEVIEYMAQAARGLHHAHEQGVVHRDIKPSNLLLNEQKTIKILDLGLGVLMDADSSASFQTADGIAVGTIDFMSPEQAMGKDVDGRSDLFSLGCSMYYLLTARFPFPGDSPVVRLGKRITGKPASIKEIRPEIPDKLVAILEKLLASKLPDRYQKGEEVAHALEKLIRRSGSTGSEAAIGSSSAPASPPSSSSSSSTPPTVRVVKPKYPGWFGWLAGMAEKSPAAAFFTMLLGLLVAACVGFAIAFLVRG